MAYIYDIADTWNASGTTFTAIKMNVTDTASAAGSLLMDLQVGGASKFSVRKDGVLLVNNSGIGSGISANGNTGSEFNISTTSGRLRIQGDLVSAYSGVFQLQSTAVLGWDGSGDNRLGSSDLILRRDAANTLAQRNGVNAQTQRLYGTYTDASNYRRLTRTMSTGGVAEIKPEGAGTGASGNVLHISGLPTSNPGAGILWNNLGTVVVGT
jgi:hypothetical protein